MKNQFITGFLSGALIFGVVGALAATYTATNNPFPVKLNGNDVQIEGYNIDGSTYFKLRDVADTVGGFDVGFNNNTIQLSKDGYTYEDTKAAVEQTYNEEESQKIYYDFLTNAKYIQTTSLSGETINNDVEKLFYYLADINNDGVCELVVSAESQKSNGICIFTIRDGKAVELYKSNMPLSGGSEMLTLGVYENQYGIYYHRENSSDDFWFAYIDDKGNLTPVFDGYHHEDLGYIINDEDVGYDKWYEISHGIKIYGFHNFDMMFPANTNTSSEIEWVTEGDLYSKYGVKFLDHINGTEKSPEFVKENKLIPSSKNVLYKLSDFSQSVINSSNDDINEVNGIRLKCIKQTIGIENLASVEYQFAKEDLVKYGIIAE